VIYGGAQKNIGPSGVTIVIVREDLLGKARPICPTMLDYKTHADNASLYNTPPCYAIYICGLVFERLIKLGGLEAMEQRNIAKAKKIYDAIAASNGFYVCPVAPAVRSNMNIPFTMATPELEKAFLKICESRGLVQLKGHRSVGGIRASVYNAMPEEGVDALVAVMTEFHAANK
jgi:phosphoserine aminotransferase